MHASENAVKPSGQQGPRLVWVAVRLTHLDAGKDAKAWVGGPAALEALKVARSIEDRRIAADPVRVLCECDRRQPQLYRPGAGPVHIASMGIPGPLGVDVVVGRLDGPIVGHAVDE